MKYIYSNSDNVPASANITPDSVSYDKNPVWKQAIQLTSLENGSSLTSLRNGDYTLIADKDYEKHWNSITLNTSYLDTLTEGINIIQADFDHSQPKTLLLTFQKTTKLQISLSANLFMRLHIILMKTDTLPIL